MMNLWIGLALLLVLALAFVVVPALKFRPVVSRDDLEQRRQKNIEVFRQRQRELKEEHAQGQWNEDEFQRLETELERSFLRDMEELDNLDSGKDRRQLGQSGLLPLLIAVLVVVPLMAVLIYRQYGAGPDLELRDVYTALAEAQTEEQQLAGLQRLADVLQARLQRHPEDIQNGYMLGTLYIQLEEFDNAISTFESIVDAVAESPRDQATVLGQLAQAQYLNSEQEITPAVQATMDRALALNANEQAVMSLLAINAFLEGDVSGALSYWRRQLTQLEPNSGQAIALQQRINQVQQVLAEREGQQPSTEADAEAGEQQAAVTVRVSMAPEISEQVDSSMRVFVFARSTEMPMPLAAQTFSVGELPLEVTLDDSMAMMSNLTLSSADSIIVGARISQSGQAIAESGDFQALSDTLVLDEIDGPVDLLISDIVP